MRVLGCVAGAALCVFLVQFPTFPQAGSEAAVRGVLDTQLKSWNDGNLEAFLDTYWKSDELTFFSAGTVTRGFEATRQRYRNRYLGSGEDMGRLTFEEISIVMLSDAGALARGRWLLVRSGKENLSGLFSLVLRKEPDGWKIIHDHTSTAD